MTGVNREAAGSADGNAAGGVAGNAAGGAAGDIERALAAVRRVTAEVLLDAPRPPRALRIRAADVCLELEWPEPAAAGHPLTVAQAPAASPAASPAAPAAPLPEPEAPGSDVVLRAPTVGIFYRAPEPGAPPFVTEGDQVMPGQQVAIVEAMKLMIPVEADQAGRVVTVLVADGHPVEYGQPLFALSTGS